MSNLLYPPLVTKKTKQNRTETKPNEFEGIGMVGRKHINSYIELSLVWGWMVASSVFAV